MFNSIAEGAQTQQQTHSTNAQYIRTNKQHELQEINGETETIAGEAPVSICLEPEVHKEELEVLQ